MFSTQLCPSQNSSLRLVLIPFWHRSCNLWGNVRVLLHLERRARRRRFMLCCSFSVVPQQSMPKRVPEDMMRSLWKTQLWLFLQGFTISLLQNSSFLSMGCWPLQRSLSHTPLSCLSAGVQDSTSTKCVIGGAVSEPAVDGAHGRCWSSWLILFNQRESVNAIV